MKIVLTTFFSIMLGVSSVFARELKCTLKDGKQVVIVSTQGSVELKLDKNLEIPSLIKKKRQKKKKNTGHLSKTDPDEGGNHIPKGNYFIEDDLTLTVSLSGLHCPNGLYFSLMDLGIHKVLRLTCFDRQNIRQKIWESPLNCQ